MVGPNASEYRRSWVTWCEVWDGFVCVCGRVAPTSSHTPTHRRMPARRHKQEVMHPPTCKPNHTPIHKPTQIHTPHTKAHPHTCAHVACSQGACRGALGGGVPRVLGQMSHGYSWVPSPGTPTPFWAPRQKPSPCFGNWPPSSPPTQTRHHG